MLKRIDPLISPELLYSLARMGHGDRLAIVDPNYPAYTSSQPVHRLDGVPAVGVVRAILSLLPLDTFVESPIARMMEVGSDEVTAVQLDVLAIAQEAAGRTFAMAEFGRGEFYERAATASALVVTGETRPYGCFIFTKGVLPEFSPRGATT